MTAPLTDRMRGFIEGLQDEICLALETEDGTGKFRQDLWQRPGGGGGRTRVLEEGAVFEKAGVNISAVHGKLDEAFARRVGGEGTEFFAAGISLVIHPRNPRVPTTHANFRFFEQGSKAWFGGGADLTPYYLFDEDAAHFHRTLKEASDRHGDDRYPKFKKWCDDYFFIPHREERRGVGGVFFDHLEGDLEREFRFVQDMGRAFIPAYVPIVNKRKALAYSSDQRRWQEIRRGRYVEFNLVYDRGTLFGLETKGRIESILMSLPPHVQWVYDHHPTPGTEEARLVDVLRNPREWA
jgi:coproporphyrinogen III oxidase